MLRFFSNEPALAREIGGRSLYSVRGFPESAVGRVIGEAACIDGTKLIAPLSGRACAAWFARVTGADALVSNESPSVVAEDAVPFLVDDGTGAAIVVASEASLLLACDVTETLGFSRKPPAEVLRFLRAHQRGRHRVRTDWRLSWQEGILAEGQLVAIVGRGRWELDSSAAVQNYRQPGRTLVVERAAPSNELYVSTFAGSRRGHVVPARRP
jgi:hypothetical protein